jgi:uncharacterized membrane protein
MSEVEKKREKLIAEIEKLTIALDEAKGEYKSFCKENPYEAPKQPTIHELRMMREKLGESKNEEHDKANKAAARRVERNKTIADAKGE